MVSISKYCITRTGIHIIKIRRSLYRLIFIMEITTLGKTVFIFKRVPRPCLVSVFCLLFGLSSDYAQPITGQVTEVTCPVIGRAQHELTPSKRQKTGPHLSLSRTAGRCGTLHWRTTTVTSSICPRSRTLWNAGPRGSPPSAPAVRPPTMAGHPQGHRAQWAHHRKWQGWHLMVVKGRWQPRSGKGKVQFIRTR